MKNTKASKIFNIALLTIILVLGMTLSVMANENDPATDSDLINTEIAGAGGEITNEEAEESDDEIINEDLDDEEDIDNDEDNPVVVEPDIGEGTGTVEPDTGEGTGVVEPKADAENEGELGDASYSDPNTGKTKVYHSNGETEEFINPPEGDFEGVLGPAASSDPYTGLTRVWYPDGHEEVFPTDVEEPTYTSSISMEPDYDNSDYLAAAAYVSDTTASEPEEVEEETVVTEEVIEPLNVEEAVLGDYEAPAERNIPFTAGLTFFSSTLIGLGVLWKLGIIAL